jgi:hypothetical protein
MSITPRPIFALAAVVSFTVACGGDSPTQPPTSLATGPAQDGGSFRIERFQTDFAFSWTDPKNGLRATHTTRPIPFMGQPELDCGPQEQLDLIDGQEVGLTDFDDLFASWIHANLDGRLWVIVRDVTQPGDCYGAKLVAEGWGYIRYTDNDVFGVGDEDNNANAWGYSARGSLTTPSGAIVGYTGNFRATVTLEKGFIQEQLAVNLR